MKHLRKFLGFCLLLIAGISVTASRVGSTQVVNTNDSWLQISLTNETVELVINDLTTNASEIHDIFFTTNLMAPDAWTWLARCAPGLTNLTVTNCPPLGGFFQLGITNAIRDGFTNNALPAEDDAPSSMADMSLAVNFYGVWYSNVWVNNNGNITFNGSLSTYSPVALNGSGVPIISPYWADVDTSNPNSAVVTYGTNIVDGRAAFGVDWVNVGYYAAHADRLLSCQLVIIDRSDITPGDFDMEFNYFKVQWEWGDVSAGDPPRAGFSDGGTNDFELSGSGVEGMFMDTNAVNGLIYNSLNSPVPGRYVFYFRDGIPSPTP